MSELDRIIQEGFARIDEAIQGVFWKYDHMPYGNGINDDSGILQACIEDLGHFHLRPVTHLISKPLQISNQCSITGSGALSTCIKMHR